MKQWQIGMLVGGLLTAWSVYDFFPGGEPSSLAVQLLNGLSLVAGLAILIGSFIMRSKERA